MRDDLLVFAEVKARATHADALESLGQRQVKRLFAAAEHFLASLPTPHTGDIRFDMITVAADGTIHHLPNALLVEG
jgi:Holliday junction resolvase-like predicted endonuclease